MRSMTPCPPVHPSPVHPSPVHPSPVQCPPGPSSGPGAPLMGAARPATRRLSRAFLPSRCAGCGQRGEVLCHMCRSGLESSRPVQVGADVVAACTYEGVVRSVILSFKYGNRRGAAPVLARLVVQRLGLASRGGSRAARGVGAAFDLVTWAPTSRRRSAERGYDQAELLARHIARQLGVPCRRLLYRSHGDPQTGMSRADRLAGPGFRPRRPDRPLRVLVVDDVVTTGATLRAAATALRAAGVGEVTAVAVAATPPAREQAARGTPGRLDAA